MKFKAKATSWNKVEAGTLVIFVSEDHWEKELMEYDRMLSNQVISYLKNDDFKAKTAEICMFPSFGKITPAKLMIVGLGKKSKLSLDSFRSLSAKIGKKLISLNAKSVAVNLSSDTLMIHDTDALTRILVEGFLLGTYRFDKYMSDKKDTRELEDVQILTNASKLQHVTNGIKEAEIHSRATSFARDLINESPTITTPTHLAHVAKSLSRRGEVRVEIVDEKEIRKLGMNSFLAVSRGSSEAPKFIKLIYSGGGRKKVVIAGKAITFDTGGLSLKDAKNMETMKLDMAGAASVLGLFSVISELKPKVTVVGLIAATENMPGSKATKPGDVVVAMNGKSIEILNTDAEGRLTLADVLSYAVIKEKPDYIVDLATLTGACMVALGEEIAGLFSNNTELSEKLIKASKVAGEKLWSLPLEDDYRESVKSTIADLRNIATSRYGGAITAALFLEEFVDGKPWAHLDIAGPAFEEKDTPIVPKGGAGFGVRTMIHFLKSF